MESQNVLDNTSVLWRTAVLFGLALLTLAGTGFVLAEIFSNDYGRVDNQNPPWIWWAVPLIGIGTCAVVVLVCVGYFVKVLLPQLRGR